VLPHGRSDRQGLSDLIREEFGLRVTFVVMALLVLVNLSNIMANFAGIAGSLELFHISRYFSVPAAPSPSGFWSTREPIKAWRRSF